MFEDTNPAELDALGGPTWVEFRVRDVAERLALVRQLRDGASPLVLSAPGGISMSTCIWAVDSARQRLNLSADPRAPNLAGLVQADEAMAVAYLENIKLQFEVRDMVLVHGRDTVALQCAMPAEIYRFQRRQAYRVRPAGRHAPLARLHHPGIPDMLLTLRAVDVSLGGCALWLPDDVPALEPGTMLGQVEMRLDVQTSFMAGLHIHHVTSLGDQGGARLGCSWLGLTGMAERTLQRWVDQSQKRTRLRLMD